MEKFLMESELIREDKIKGEIQINYFRIGLLIVSTILVIMIDIGQKKILLADIVNYINVAVGIVYSIIFLKLLYNNKYFVFLTYVSATFDIFLITLTLYFNQFAYNSSIATIPLVFGFALYFVEIIISVRRHNFNNTMYTSFLSFLSYTYIIIFMYKHGVFYNLFTAEKGDYVIWLDVGNEFSKSIIILITGYISAYLSKNFDKIFYKGITTEIEKENIKNVFGRYLSNEVVDKILKREIKLEGEKREITIMFIDIKNFTTLSEKISPEKLLTILNIYFQKITEIIQKYNGYINKFLGDGVLVFFGAPLINENHKNDSLNCAIKIIQSLDTIRKKINFILEENNIQWDLNIGIGVNTGPAVIGNVGSTGKLEYTAIGDSVNTAERIEELTRKMDKNILISESTLTSSMKNLIEKAFIVKLKGKEESIKVFSLKI